MDTAPLKTALAARAAQGEAAVLTQLLSKTVQVARRVCERCEQLEVQALAECTGVRSVLERKVGTVTVLCVPLPYAVTVSMNVAKPRRAWVGATMPVPLELVCLMPPQAQLLAMEAELRDMMTWLAASRERDTVRFAYRHPTPDADMELATQAQAWPKRMYEVLHR